MPRPFAVIGFSALLSLTFLFFLPEWFVYPVLGLAAVGFVVSLLLHKKGQSTAVPAAFASIALASLLLLAQLAVRYYPVLQAAGEELDIRARIVSNAEQRYGRYYYQLRTISVNGEAKQLKLRLSSPYALEAEPYDEVSYNGAIYRLGQDDPNLTTAYKAKGVYLGSYAQSYGEDRFTVTSGGFHIMKPILLAQRAIARNLDYTYSDDVAGLLRGMLLGNTNGLTWAAQQDFSQIGVIHLFSVSGLHMTLLAWSFFRLLCALKCKRKLAAPLSMGFILFFMALTGFTASCVRAGVMTAIMLAGELFTRRADTLNSLGFAALVLLLFSPLSAGQVGLSLSFAATLGIILFSKRFASPMKKRCKALPKLPRKLLLAVIESLSLTASVLVLTVPIQLLRMTNGVSLIVLPANLLIIPFASVVMIVGGVSAMLPEALRNALAFLIEPLGQLLLKGAHLMADLPAPVLRGNAASLAIPIAVCAAIAAAALVRRYAGKPVPLRYTAGTISAVMLLAGWLPGLITGRQTHITQLETGAGKSVLVSRGRKAALLGCGGDQLPAGAAKRALSEIGARELELLLIPGSDEGAAELQRDMPIQVILEDDGVTPFALWDGTDGIFYKNGDDAACLLRTEREVVLIQFSGEIPKEWQEVKRLGYGG